MSSGAAGWVRACSAAASMSGALESVGDPGPGKWVTIYATAGHAYIEVAGIYFDTAAGLGNPPNPPHRSALEHRRHRAGRVRGPPPARALTALRLCACARDGASESD